MKWLKKKILKWLGLDYEIYIGADVCYRSQSSIIIIKQKQSGSIEVIGDQKLKSRDYQRLLREIWDIAKKYKCKNIIVDRPRGFPY